MATKLSVYKAALRLCGDRSLSDLTDDTEARYILDDEWDADFIDYVLEKGQWNFCQRTATLEYDSGYTATEGYSRRFAKPSDFIRLCAISDEPTIHNPLTRFENRGSYLFAEIDAIYIRYVSNDSSWGSDLTTWPPSFTEYAEAELAVRIAPGLTTATSKVDDLEKTRDKALKDALSTDAMQTPSRPLPHGSWVNARRGGRISRESAGWR